eukprot:scaffold50979_cov61-Phaeocystis_antarctica.AAC.7
MVTRAPQSSPRVCADQRPQPCVVRSPPSASRIAHLRASPAARSTHLFSAAQPCATASQPVQDAPRAPPPPPRVPPLPPHAECELAPQHRRRRCRGACCLAPHGPARLPRADAPASPSLPPLSTPPPPRAPCEPTPRRHRRSTRCTVQNSPSPARPQPADAPASLLPPP